MVEIFPQPRTPPDGELRLLRGEEGNLGLGFVVVSSTLLKSGAHGRREPRMFSEISFSSELP